MAAGTTNSMAATTTKLVHRERLAVRLLQNWNALHPEDAPPSGPASAGVMFAGMHPLLSPTTPPAYSQQQQQQQLPKPQQQLSHVNPVVTVSPTVNQLHRPQPLPISRPRTAAGLQIGNKFQRSLSYTAGVGGGVTASPAADTTVDDSLTSLTWLQNLNVLKLSAAAQSATARVSPTGNCLSGTAVVGGGSASGLPTQYGQPHQSATRPTGAVQPFQHRPPQSLANTSQRLDSVDPNAILDMSPHLMTASSASMALCRSSSMKQETEMLTSATAGSSPRSSSCHSPPLITSHVGVGRNGLPNCSPPLPRLSPQTVHGYAHDHTSGSGMSGDLSGSSPSPPALQAQGSCGGSGTKPNHSYATLICMAMNDAADHRVTLSGIYAWIMENFPYYKSADLSWQNSIRHNLSLNKCFQRVQRDKSDPQGKGNYWTFNPDFQQIVERDMFRNSSGSGKRSASAAGLSGASGPLNGSGGNSAGYAGSRHSSTSNKRHCGNGRRVSADESLPQQKRNSGRRSCAAKSDVIVDENSELEVPLLPEDDEDDDEDVAAAAESTVGRLEDSLDLTAALDMSWSYILGRDIDQPPSPQQPQQQQQQQPQIPISRHSTVLTSSTPSAGAVIFAGNSALNGGNISTSVSSAILDDVDEEGNFDVLDELIRACAETDEDFRQPLDPRSSVDLTIYGVGLRPPDWWPLDDIDVLAEAIGCNVPGLTTSVTCDDVVNRNSSPGVSMATGGDDAAAARHRFTSSSSLVERPHPWAENRERDRFISGIIANGSSNSPQTNNTGRHDVSAGDLFDSSLDGPDQLFLTATTGSRIGSTTYDIDDF